MDANANTLFLNENIRSIIFDLIILFDPVQTIGIRFACRQALHEFDTAAIRYVEKVIRTANTCTGMFDLPMRCAPSFDTSQLPHAFRELRIDINLDHDIIERFRTTYATDVRSGQIIDADARMHAVLHPLLHLHLHTLHFYFTGHAPAAPNRFTPSWLLRICISDLVAALAHNPHTKLNTSCLRISYDALDTPSKPHHPHHARWHADLCDACRRKCARRMDSASTVYWPGGEPPVAVLETVEGGKGAVFAAYSRSKWRLHSSVDGEGCVGATECVKLLAESCVQRRFVEVALADVL
jgi:hypothetical protein